MYEINLKIKCKRPELIKKSLEPEIENSKKVKTKIKVGKGYIEINIKSKKISHLKAIINSYISLISMLLKVEGISDKYA